MAQGQRLVHGPHQAALQNDTTYSTAQEEELAYSTERCALAQIYDA
jgi:hypothetical protein